MSSVNSVNSFKVLIVEDDPSQISMFNALLPTLIEKVNTAWNTHVEFVFTNNAVDGIAALRKEAFKQINIEDYQTADRASIQADATEFQVAILDNNLVGDMQGIEIPTQVQNSKIVYGFRSTDDISMEILKAQGFHSKLPKNFNLDKIVDFIGTPFRKADLSDEKTSAS